MRLARACLAIATLVFAGSLRAEDIAEETMETAAEPHAAPAVEPAASQGTWSVSADFVFLKPSVGDTFFAVANPVSNTVPNGDRKNNDPDYEPGFRVAGGYQLPGSGRELELAYTRLAFDQSETLGGSFLFATLGTADFASNFENYAGSAESQLDLTYERIDASFAQPVRISDLDLSLHFGIEYASTRLREEYRYSRAIALGQVGETSRTWGIGPQAGIGLGYELLASQGWLPGDLSVGILSSASLLISQADSRANNTADFTPGNGVVDPTVFLDVTDEDTSRIVPAFHTRLGFTYGMPVMGLASSVSVGYQLDTYLGMLTQVAYPDDVGDGLATTDTEDFDTQGLYVSGTLRF
jgi:hypothetical protein